MANVTVVGAQWGDEGKGKIVDWLASRADVVVRFQGGHNAGHTLVIGNQTYKLALLPSGIVRPGKLSVIGNGVVLDPHHLVAEIGKLEAQGVAISPDNLKIAENVSLILSLHRELDAHREESGEGGTKIGTTKRGIGPAYEDKPGFIGRFATTLGDAGINIATFALGRDQEGGSAIALVEVDGDVPQPVLDRIQVLPGVKAAKVVRF